MRYLLSRIGYANSGLKYFFSNERNGRTQAIVAIVVIIMGFVFQLTNMEWCIVMICIASVLGLEMMNTSLEMVCNFLTRDYDERIKHIKDISAGAVWFVTIITIIIGMVIFIPHILTLLNY